MMATTETIMTTLRKAIVTTTLAVAIGAGAYEAYQATKLAAQAQTMLHQPDPLAEKVRQLQQERDEATNRLASMTEEAAALRANSTELLKLREQAVRLEEVSQEVACFEAAGGTLSRLEKMLAQANEHPVSQRQAFRRQVALNQLARLKLIAGLTPDQEQSIRDLLLKRVDLGYQEMQEDTEGTLTQERKDQFQQSSTNLTAQIDALFSPDQQASLQTSRQRDKETWARMNADGELMMMQNCIGTSRDQEAQLFPILYDSALTERTGGSTNTAEKAEALARVLTPAQMELYRKFMQDKSVQTVIQMGRK
jgi:hypothetical protein